MFTGLPRLDGGSWFWPTGPYGSIWAWWYEFSSKLLSTGPSTVLLGLSGSKELCPGPAQHAARLLGVFLRESLCAGLRVHGAPWSTSSPCTIVIHILGATKCSVIQDKQHNSEFLQSRHPLAVSSKTSFALGVLFPPSEDLTPLLAEYEGPLAQPIIAAAGSDISFWFDEAGSRCGRSVRWFLEGEFVY